MITDNYYQLYYRLYQLKYFLTTKKFINKKIFRLLNEKFEFNCLKLTINNLNEIWMNRHHSFCFHSFCFYSFCFYSFCFLLFFMLHYKCLIAFLIKLFVFYRCCHNKCHCKFKFLLLIFFFY